MSIVDDIIALQEENDTLRQTLHDVREALSMLMTIVDGLIEENLVDEPVSNIEPATEEELMEEEEGEGVWEVMDVPINEPEPEERYQVRHFGNEDEKKQGSATYRVDVSDFLDERGL